MYLFVHAHLCMCVHECYVLTYVHLVPLDRVSVDNVGICMTDTFIASDRVFMRMVGRGTFILM
jgi:hypothetical protein